MTLISHQTGETRSDPAQKSSNSVRKNTIEHQHYHKYSRPVKRYVDDDGYPVPESDIK